MYRFYYEKNLNVEVINTHRSIDGRKILLNLKIENNIVTIVNVYAPNIEQNRIDFFKKLNGFIRNYALSTDTIVLCGDFNCCKERKNDKSFFKTDGHYEKL